ncbi:MAG TPA: hypothetical protein EYO84_05505 [Planctomycetes bacterium]|nr:hypothetical protein [Planctomycetota bacterium]
MLCEKCQQNEATVHLTDVANQVKQEYHLCSECARVHGVSVPAQFQKFKSFTLPDFFTHQSQESDTEQAESPPENCPRCKMSYSKFRRDGKFGCSHDFTVFRSTLEDLFKKIHNSSQHIGRTPSCFRKENSHRIQLDGLREELKRAVQGEQYEKAAEIRDQMRLMGRN